MIISVTVDGLSRRIADARLAGIAEAARRVTLPATTPAIVPTNMAPTEPPR